MQYLRITDPIDGDVLVFKPCDSEEEASWIMEETVKRFDWSIWADIGIPNYVPAVAELVNVEIVKEYPFRSVIEKVCKVCADREEDKRLIQEDIRRANEKKERAEYERLKKKFENTSL